MLRLQSALELEKMKELIIPAHELEKVKNKTESLIAFEDVSLMNRATSLALYELLGDASLMNRELENYQAVSAEDIQNEMRVIFRENNSNTLYYYSDN